MIDTECCAGHGRCHDVAPALFADDEDGMGIVNGDGSVAADHVDAASAGTAVPGTRRPAVPMIL
jgi:ferredoxin